MQINTDLSTDSTLASLLRQSTTTGATASQSSSSAANSSAAGPMDASLQRLTDLPASVQDADWEIQDEESAAQALQTARQSILQIPNTALAAQANQLSDNVLSLLE